MPYQFHHVHLRAVDPHKTAKWYSDHFGAKLVSEATGLGGAKMLGLDLSGVRVNVSGQPVDQKLPRGSAESHLGLDHFGVQVDNIDAEMARLERENVPILLPLTQMATGAKIAFVQGPDDVRIELLQMP